MMDEEVRKVLRRACVRYRTGIRKPFKLDGCVLTIEPDGSYRDPDVGDSEGCVCEATLVVHDTFFPANALDGTRRVKRLDLFEVTPEAVYTAYLQSQVDQVHAR